MSKLPGKSLPTPSSRVLPTSVAQVGTITKYELLNYFRSRRFFILPVRRGLELLNIVSYRRTRIHFLLQFTLQEQLNVDPRDRHPLSLCLQPNPTHPVRSRADRTVVHHYVWFRNNWKRADGYLPHYTAY